MNTIGRSINGLFIDLYTHVDERVIGEDGEEQRVPVFEQYLKETFDIIICGVHYENEYKFFLEKFSITLV